MRENGAQRTKNCVTSDFVVLRRVTRQRAPSAGDAQKKHLEKNHSRHLGSSKNHNRPGIRENSVATVLIRQSILRRHTILNCRPSDFAASVKLWKRTGLPSDFLLSWMLVEGKNRKRWALTPSGSTARCYQLGRCAKVGDGWIGDEGAGRRPQRPLRARLMMELAGSSGSKVEASGEGLCEAVEAQALSIRLRGCLAPDAYVFGCSNCP
ncbi:unnamed protein product [Caenorhabditis auriculariae]|uniref:Uncharacterized protein n=1 Tax=Caenorhabditis auriculariae TaxID=2777116 RepID=A0A8S1HXR4_9PELO|nr:unnamed protein product [Caenorhabditis auriculariae]